MLKTLCFSAPRWTIDYAHAMPRAVPSQSSHLDYGLYEKGTLLVAGFSILWSRMVCSPRKDNDWIGGIRRQWLSAGKVIQTCRREIRTLPRQSATPHLMEMTQQMD